MARFTTIDFHVRTILLTLAGLGPVGIVFNLTDFHRTTIKVNFLPSDAIFVQITALAIWRENIAKITSNVLRWAWWKFKKDVSKSLSTLSSMIFEYNIPHWLQDLRQWIAIQEFLAHSPLSVQILQYLWSSRHLSLDFSFSLTRLKLIFYCLKSWCALNIKFIPGVGFNRVAAGEVVTDVCSLEFVLHLYNRFNFNTSDYYKIFQK